MDNLPTPEQQGPSPMAQQTTPQESSPIAPAESVQATNDPGALLTQAIEQVESVIANTATSPSDRADQIHAVKAAYLNGAYNLNSSGQ